MRSCQWLTKTSLLPANQQIAEKTKAVYIPVDRTDEV